MICRSFDPIFAPEAKVMIVGSMPSVKSLADAQYYAHPRNAFWPILFDIFGEMPHNEYVQKKELIVAKKTRFMGRGRLLRAGGQPGQQHARRGV